MTNDKDIIKDSNRGEKSISTSRIISGVTNVTVIVVVLFVGALFNVGLNRENLTNATTWMIILASVPLSSMAFKAAVDFMVGTRLPNREIARDTKVTYDSNIDKLEDDFDPTYLNIHNRNEKIKKYRDIISKQKQKLSNKYANQSKWKFWKKKMSKEDYEKRLEELQECSTDAYIEKNIDKLSVKYTVVYSAHFSKIVKDTIYKHNIDATLSSTMRKQLRNKVISKFIFGVLAAMVVVNVGNPQYSSFVGLIALNCVIQFVAGLVRSVDIYDSSVLTPMELKIAIMNSYFSWKLKNPTEVERIKREAEERVLQKELEAKQKVEEEKERLNLQMNEKIEEIKSAVGL